MRLPGRRGTAAAQRQMGIPPFVVCPVCNLRNEVTARFCRECGLPLGAPRDPVRGTTTRRAELPSDHGAGMAAVLSLVATVVIAGAAGFFVLRGFESGSTTAAATPTPVSSAGPAGSVDGSPGPIASVPASSEVPASLEPETTAEPDPIETVGPVDGPTDDPGQPVTPAITTSTRYTCGDAAIKDPTAGRWRITRARASAHTAFDRVTLDLERASGRAQRGTVVAQDFIKPARAVAQYGVATPTGQRALVISFDRLVSLRTPLTDQPSLAVIKSLEARRGADGMVHLVVGVEGDGCARMLAADWGNGSAETTTAQLTIDVRR